MTSDNFPIPISGGEQGPWLFPQIEPINLIALLPPSSQLTNQPQITLDEAIDLLSSVAGSPFTIIDQPPPSDQHVRWAALIAGPSQPAPLVIWLEPVRPMSEENIRTLKAEDVKWILGIETALQHERAHEHLLSLIQLLGRAFPDSPAILNVNTGAWHPREELDARLLLEGVKVSPALCFLVHVIGNEAPLTSSTELPSEPASELPAIEPLWCYTNGLWTTARPELEMHGIPYSDGRFAGFMLNSIAELVYESGLPAPGEPYEIGPDLLVRFMPWEQAAAATNPKWLGSTNKREDHEGRPLTGARIAVCALDSLSWPGEAAEKIKRGEAILFKTKQATERDAPLARKTLDHFADLFALVPPGRRDDSPQRLAAFLIKAGFALPQRARKDIEDDREHLWFEATRCEPQRIRGRLVNEPIAIAHLRQGQDIWIDRNLVSDWQVITQRGRYGPEEHSLAQQTLENLVREAAHA